MTMMMNIDEMSVLTRGKITNSFNQSSNSKIHKLHIYYVPQYGDVQCIVYEFE